MEVLKLPLRVGAVTPNGGLFNYKFKLSHDPVNPLEAATLNYLNNKADLYVDKNNGSIQGPLTINYNATDVNHIVSRQYIDQLKAQLDSDPIKNYFNLKLNTLINKSTDNVSAEVIVSQDPVQDTQVATLNYLNQRVTQITNSATPLSPILSGTIIPFSSSQTVSTTSYLRCNGALIDKTASAYSNMANIIGTKFNKNSLPGAGVPWLNQYDFNFFIQPSTLTFSSGVSSPQASLYPMSFVTKNKIYLIIGGTTVDQPFNTYRADLDIDGNFTSWSTVAVTYPYGRMVASCVAAYKNYVYMIGNLKPSSREVTNYVIRTSINPTTGDIDNWQTQPSYPISVSHAACAITKNTLIVAGGYIGGGFNSTSSYTAQVYYNTFAANGNLTSWQAAPSLPAPRAAGSLVVIGNNIYYIAGKDGQYLRSEIFVASIDQNGLIGPWSLFGYLPNTTPTTGINSPNYLLTKNSLLIFGANASADSKCYKYTINGDNTLGAGSEITVPNNIYSGSSGVCVKNKYYLFGGMPLGSSGSSYTKIISIAGGLNDYSEYNNYDVNNLAFGNMINLPDLRYREQQTPGIYYYIKL